MTLFIEEGVRDCDFVLVVCTPTYGQKADRRRGGVGYDDSIMTADLAEKGNQRKCIPILRAGSKTDSVPTWAQGKKYLDLTTRILSKEATRPLVEAILRTEGSARPRLGEVGTSGGPPANPKLERLVRELDDDHFRVLRALLQPPNSDPPGMGSPDATLRRRVPGLSSARLSQFAEDPDREGLAARMVGLVMVMTGPGAEDLRGRVTPWARAAGLRGVEAGSPRNTTHRITLWFGSVAPLDGE